MKVIYLFIILLCIGLINASTCPKGLYPCDEGLSFVVNNPLSNTGSSSSSCSCTSTSMNYNNLVLNNQTRINFTEYDTILTLNANGSMLDGSPASGGIQIIQEQPMAKGGIFFRSYDPFLGRNEITGWFTCHYNSSSYSSGVHQHCSIETLDNSTGSPSVNSKFTIEYGANMSVARITFPGSYVSQMRVDDIFSNYEDNIDLKADLNVRMYPNRQTTYGLSIGNNTGNLTVTGLGVNDIEFLDNIFARNKNVTADHFKGDGGELTNILYNYNFSSIPTPLINNYTIIQSLDNSSRLSLYNITGTDDQACTGTDKVTNVSLKNGILSILCGTDQTGGGSSTFNSSYDYHLSNLTAHNTTYQYNFSQVPIPYNSTKLTLLNLTGIDDNACSGTDKVSNVTINNGILTITCTTDQSGSSSALTTYSTYPITTNATGLTPWITLYTIPLTANTNYSINCYMLHSSNATTSGIRYNMSLPASPDWMAISMSASTTATASQYSVVSGTTISLMPIAVTASLAYPTFLPDQLNIFIDGNQNTGGNAIFQFSGELAMLRATVGKGSYCEVNVIT